VRETEFIQEQQVSQDELYTSAAAEFGPALDRLARAYESHADRRRDLLQEIHLQLWRSFATFDGRCSARTWIYRVAHNTAASYVIRERRTQSKLVTLEDLERMPAGDTVGPVTDREMALQKLRTLIQQLQPVDRQVMVSYLEDMEAASIAEITGLSAANVAMKIHRIKSVLTRRFHEGGRHA
jgi:RNA polymerase sigma-70 factor (ECF subfamily)